MPDSQEYMLLIHEHQHQRRRRDRSHQRHASARPVRASTMSTFKLIALDETSSHSHGTHRRDTDFLLTNGNVYALKVDPPARTELVRLQQIFAPLKPDHPIPEYKPRSRPYQETFNSPTPVIEIGGNGDCSRDSDEMSNYNGDSDLSTKGEAVATKLNDIIQRMETKLYSSGDDDDPCVHNPLLEEKETFKEDPSQSTYIKIIETIAIDRM